MLGSVSEGKGLAEGDAGERRQTSSIPELCAHIFVRLSSRVSSADAMAWRKGLLLFILSLPLVPSLKPFSDLFVCSREA